MSTAKRQRWTGGVIGCGLVFAVGSFLLLAFTDGGSAVTLVLGLIALTVGLLAPKR